MNNQLEQIKAEIKSLKNCSSPIVICDTLLSFIESLQQELLSSVETAESCEREKQMMKDAVEAEVVTPVYRGPDTKMTQLVTFGTCLKVGDKVKLIIIPETPEYTEGVTGHYTTTTK